MRRVAMLMVMLLVSSPDWAQSKKTDLNVPFQISRMTFVAAAGADLGTTIRARHDLQESNPILGKSCGQQVAVTAGMTAVSLLLSNHLYRHGHPKLAIFLNLLGTGVHGWAATHNWSLEQK